MYCTTLEDMYCTTPEDMILCAEIAADLRRAQRRQQQAEYLQRRLQEEALLRAVMRRCLLI